MKINENFIAHNDGDELILVSTGASDFSGLVHSNRTAGFILECLKEETSEAEIIAAMLEKYDAPEEVISRDVKKIIGQLRKIGALDE